MPENHMRNTYTTHYHSCKTTDFPASQKVQFSITVNSSQRPEPDSQKKEGNKRPQQSSRGEMLLLGAAHPNYLLGSFPNQVLPTAGSWARQPLTSMGARSNM